MRVSVAMLADVVVAGGGMVGTATALALARLSCMQQRRVVLLEAGPPPTATLTSPYPAAPYSNRVSALSPGSAALLAQLGCWDAVLAARAGPVTSMRVWDGCSPAGISFRGSPAAPLAWMVENEVTVAALTAGMAEAANLEVRYQTRVGQCRLPGQEGDPAVVELEGGEKLETALLVGADGAGSAVRAALGTGWTGWEYGQMGVVATLQLQHSRQEEEGNTTAWQRFLPSGPLALLPLASNAASLVWSTDREEARQLLKLDSEPFLHKLNTSLTSTAGHNQLVNSISNSFSLLLNSLLPGPESRAGAGWEPPRVTGVSNRAAFPLGFGHAPRYCGRAVALVGDAAHRLHPLAGQGVNLGLGDAVALAEAVEGALREGARLGDPAVLARYETERQRHNLPTMLGADCLHRLYTTAAAPAVLARSLGLQAVNAFPPVKRLLQQHASGQ